MSGSFLRLHPGLTNRTFPSSEVWNGFIFLMAGYRETLDPGQDTLIKLNLSWTKYFPSCSSQP